VVDGTQVVEESELARLAGKIHVHFTACHPIQIERTNHDETRKPKMTIGSPDYKNDRCKFCGCTEDHPCFEDGQPCGWVIFHGNSRLSLVAGGVVTVELLDNVCSSRACIEMAYREAATAVAMAEL
jgi:hypothetical protein